MLVRGNAEPASITRKGLPDRKPFSFCALAIAPAVTARRRLRGVVAVFAAVKAGIEGVEVLAVQFILGDAQGFTESLEMNDFPLPQELDGGAYVRIIHQAQDIVISAAGLLLCGHVFEQISDNIPFGLKFAGIKGDTACRLGPDSQCMVYIVLVKAAFFNFFHAQVAGELEYDGADDLQMSQFLGAYLVLRNVPNQALCGQAQCLRLICT